MGTDFWIVLRMWVVLFFLGAAAIPFTKRLFSSWWDGGYLFSKAVGFALVTYLSYILGTLHILPFTTATLYFLVAVIAVSGFLFIFSVVREKGEIRIRLRSVSLNLPPKQWTKFIFEELFFFASFLLWSWIKGHEASIRALEKFMDYGFTRTILNSSYFPAPDMWFAGFPINYYYFGHIGMAVLTKLSGIDLAYTFNLMLAVVFAFCVTMSFSIGYQLFAVYFRQSSTNNADRSRGYMQKSDGWQLKALIAGILTSFLVSLAGNMQTIYAFTRGYTGEDVKPFWELAWGPDEFLSRLPEGMQTYWYANATRFIPLTIHEFPSYSFVVSDMHGHVLAIPVGLLTIAFLFQMFGLHRTQIYKERIFQGIFFGLLAAMLLMTNALDGPIYIMLFITVLAYTSLHSKHGGESIVTFLRIAAATVFSWIVFSLPFLYHFRSFVSGLAVNCPPAFMANSKIGPILFEGVEKCQHSPVWMWWLLWGFFVYCGIAFILWKLKVLNSQIKNAWGRAKDVFLRLAPHELLLVIFFFFSLALVIFPEFFYFKDIYPAHFRSNTMFKLGYQAFILFSIISGYTIVTLMNWGKNDHNQNIQYPITNFQKNFKKQISNINKEPYSSLLQGKSSIIVRTIFFVLLIPQLFLVSIYPYFSVRSYFGGLKEYQSLYGLNWMINEYPDTYKAIRWLESRIIPEEGSGTNVILEQDCQGRQITGSHFPLPVIAEADGDSYTDYNMASAFTGLPTVAGWAVHEWLWRGCYDVVAPRREDVRQIFESSNAEHTNELLSKYNVRYILVGKQEREKFTNLNEDLLLTIGKEVFRSNDTFIVEVR